MLITSKNTCTTMFRLELDQTTRCHSLVNPKGNQSWIFIRRTDAEVPTLGPPDVKSWLIRKDWCWERLKAGEGGDRGRDGWMASLTQWAWVWVSSGSWWWTGKLGMLQSMGSQRVGHYWATELNWMYVKCFEESPAQSNCYISVSNH